MEEEKRKKFSVSRDILSGQLLIKSGLVTRWKFILYCFILIILFISYNMSVERLQMKLLKNQEELALLKDECSGKYAKLQNISKRSQITERLKELGSKVENPTSPAVIVEIEK